MKCVVLLYVLAALAILVPGGLCDDRFDEERALRRNRRTVQFLVNHFVQFLGLSGPSASAGTKKVEPKQDNVYANPLTSILKASAGKFSGFSGGKQKPSPTSHREPTLQHDLPTWIEDRKTSNPYSEAFEADALEPTRVSLLSTTQEPEPEDTTTTTTTTMTTEAPPPMTTPESAPIAPTELPEELPEATTVHPEPSSSQPEQLDQSSTAPEAAEDQPQEELGGASSTEAAPAIDPAAVNTLSDTRIDVRNGFGDERFQPTPIPLVSYQHYVHQAPAVWPPTAGFQAQFPAQQYFGNNVFYPAQAQFPLASPFQLQQVQPSQGYPSNQPLYDNRLYYPTAAASPAIAKSHSRVKLHDNPYDLVTYHDDTEPAASTYQMQTFGNYRGQRY